MCRVPTRADLQSPVVVPEADAGQALRSGRRGQLEAELHRPTRPELAAPHVPAFRGLENNHPQDWVLSIDKVNTSKT